MDNNIKKIDDPEKLFDFLKHGGKDHQEWLKRAIYAYNENKPKPQYKP